MLQRTKCGLKCGLEFPGHARQVRAIRKQSGAAAYLCFTPVGNTAYACSGLRIIASYSLVVLQRTKRIGFDS